MRAVLWLEDHPRLTILGLTGLVVLFGVLQ